MEEICQDRFDCRLHLADACIDSRCRRCPGRCAKLARHQLLRDPAVGIYENLRHFVPLQDAVGGSGQNHQLYERAAAALRDRRTRIRAYHAAA
ncbi:hypothetical protein D3C73_1322280 [compost metagenome]